jgi:uncharacterized protein (TIGR02996 family)
MLADMNELLSALRAILGPLGWKVELRFNPWKRSAEFFATLTTPAMATPNWTERTFSQSTERTFAHSFFVDEMMWYGGTSPDRSYLDSLPMRIAHDFIGQLLKTLGDEQKALRTGRPLPPIDTSTKRGQFIAAMRAAPDDADLRVIFADWCEQNGDDALAEKLRKGPVRL